MPVFSWLPRNLPKPACVWPGAGGHTQAALQGGTAALEQAVQKFDGETWLGKMHSEAACGAAHLQRRAVRSTARSAAPQPALSRPSAAACSAAQSQHTCSAVRSAAQRRSRSRPEQARTCLRSRSIYAVH